MTWSKKRRNTYSRERSNALSRAINKPTHVPLRGRGSIGGAPIWVMAEAFVPFTDSAWTGGGQRNYDADPDGFAVFGRFPKGWFAEIVRLRLLGEIGREEILHVCSGTLAEKWTVDIRAQAKPKVQASGDRLPFPAGVFGAVLLDPPYSDMYAKHLYGTENPRPAWLLREAARVVRPGGRIGMLHVAVPFAPPGCRLWKVFGVTTGVGFRIRAFTIYQREQEAML